MDFRMEVRRAEDGTWSRTWVGPLEEDEDMGLNALRSAEGHQSARWTRDTALVSGDIPVFFPHDLGYWWGAFEHDDRSVVHGRWLCDLCGDAMTNDIVTPAESPTGEESAVCSGCRVAGGS